MSFRMATNERRQGQPKDKASHQAPPPHEHDPTVAFFAAEQRRCSSQMV
jgi:hypothetical protein